METKKLTISDQAILGYLRRRISLKETSMPKSPTILGAAKKAVGKIVKASSKIGSQNDVSYWSDGKWVVEIKEVSEHPTVVAFLGIEEWWETPSMMKTAKKSLGWSYIRLPEKVRNAMKKIRDSIDPDDLGEDGKEGHPHISALYGLTTFDPDEVKRAVAGNRGGKVRMGKTSLFSNEERDVLKVSVSSHALHSLHRSLKELDNEDKFDEYHPHATLAYLKPGTGKKYGGLETVDGMEFDFDTLIFEDARDNKTEILLDGTIPEEKPKKKSSTLVRVVKISQFDEEDAFEIIDDESQSQVKEELKKEVERQQGSTSSFFENNDEIFRIEKLQNNGEWLTLDYENNAIGFHGLDLAIRDLERFFREYPLQEHNKFRIVSDKLGVVFSGTQIEDPDTEQPLQSDNAVRYVIRKRDPRGNWDNTELVSHHASLEQAKNALWDILVKKNTNPADYRIFTNFAAVIPRDQYEDVFRNLKYKVYFKPSDAPLNHNSSWTQMSDNTNSIFDNYITAWNVAQAFRQANNIEEERVAVFPLIANRVPEQEDPNSGKWTYKLESLTSEEERDWPENAVKCTFTRKSAGERYRFGQRPDPLLNSTLKNLGIGKKISGPGTNRIRILTGYELGVLRSQTGTFFDERNMYRIGVGDTTWYSTVEDAVVNFAPGLADSRMNFPERNRTPNSRLVDGAGNNFYLEGIQNGNIFVVVQRIVQPRMTHHYFFKKPELRSLQRMFNNQYAAAAIIQDDALRAGYNACEFKIVNVVTGAIVSFLEVQQQLNRTAKSVNKKIKTAQLDESDDFPIDIDEEAQYQVQQEIQQEVDKQKKIEEKTQEEPQSRDSSQDRVEPMTPPFYPQYFRPSPYYWTGINGTMYRDLEEAWTVADEFAREDNITTPGLIRVVDSLGHNVPRPEIYCYSVQFFDKQQREWRNFPDNYFTGPPIRNARGNNFPTEESAIAPRDFLANRYPGDEIGILRRTDSITNSEYFKVQFDALGNRDWQDFRDEAFGEQFPRNRFQTQEEAEEAMGTADRIYQGSFISTRVLRVSPSNVSASSKTQMTKKGQLDEEDNFPLDINDDEAQQQYQEELQREVEKQRQSENPKTQESYFQVMVSVGPQEWAPVDDYSLPRNLFPNGTRFATVQEATNAQNIIRRDIAPNHITSVRLTNSSETVPGVHRFIIEQLIDGEWDAEAFMTDDSNVRTFANRQQAWEEIGRFITLAIREAITIHREDFRVVETFVHPDSIPREETPETPTETPNERSPRYIIEQIDAEGDHIDYPFLEVDGSTPRSFATRQEAQAFLGEFIETARSSDQAINLNPANYVIANWISSATMTDFADRTPPEGTQYIIETLTNRGWSAETFKEDNSWDVIKAFQTIEEAQRYIDFYINLIADVDGFEINPDHLRIKALDGASFVNVAPVSRGQYIIERRDGREWNNVEEFMIDNDGTMMPNRFEFKEAAEEALRMHIAQIREEDPTRRINSRNYRVRNLEEATASIKSTMTKKGQFDDESDFDLTIDEETQGQVQQDIEQEVENDREKFTVKIWDIKHNTLHAINSYPELKQIFHSKEEAKNAIEHNTDLVNECLVIESSKTGILPDVQIIGSVNWNNLTSVPKGFNPTVAMNLLLDAITSIPEGFNPVVGGTLKLNSITSIPENFHPTVGLNLHLDGVKIVPESFHPKVGGILNLNGATSIPKDFNPEVGSGLYFYDLPSLPLDYNPTNVKGAIYLGRSKIRLRIASSLQTKKTAQFEEEEDFNLDIDPEMTRQVQEELQKDVDANREKFTILVKGSGGSLSEPRRDELRRTFISEEEARDAINENTSFPEHYVIQSSIRGPLSSTQSEGESWKIQYALDGETWVDFPATANRTYDNVERAENVIDHIINMPVEPRYNRESFRIVGVTEEETPVEENDETPSRQTQGTQRYIIDHYTSQGWDHNDDATTYASVEAAERVIERAVSDPDNVRAGFSRATLRVFPCYFKVMWHNERQGNWEDCMHSVSYDSRGNEIPNRYDTREDAELAIDTIIEEHHMDRDELLVRPVSIVNTPEGRRTPSAPMSFQTPMVTERRDGLSPTRSTYRVEVVRNGRWEIISTHATPDEARGAVTRLRINFPARQENIRIVHTISASSAKPAKTAQFEEDDFEIIDEDAQSQVQQEIEQEVQQEIEQEVQQEKERNKETFTIRLVDDNGNFTVPQSFPELGSPIFNSEQEAADAIINCRRPIARSKLRIVSNKRGLLQEPPGYLLQEKDTNNNWNNIIAEYPNKEEAKKAANRYRAGHPHTNPNDFRISSKYGNEVMTFTDQEGEDRVGMLIQPYYKWQRIDIEGEWVDAGPRLFGSEEEAQENLTSYLEERERTNFYRDYRVVRENHPENWEGWENVHSENRPEETGWFKWQEMQVKINGEIVWEDFGIRRFISEQFAREELDNLIARDDREPTRYRVARDEEQNNEPTTRPYKLEIFIPNTSSWSPLQEFNTLEEAKQGLRTYRMALPERPRDNSRVMSTRSILYYVIEHNNGNGRRRRLDVRRFNSYDDAINARNRYINGHPEIDQNEMDIVPYE